MSFKLNTIAENNRLLSKTGIISFLLLAFAFCRYFFLYRYTILMQEQSQMFMFTRSYLLHYLHQPGGIAVWAGAFLTQFFIYPAAGVCIYSLVFFALCYEYRKTQIRLSVFGKPSSVACIPALLILPLITGVQFDIGTELSLVAALVFFRLLTAVAKYRYAPVMIFFISVAGYTVTAGNVALTAALFLIFCLQHRQKHCLLQAAAVIAAWLAAPFVFSYTVYPVSIDMAYRLCTPWDKMQANVSVFRTVSWLSVALLPLAGMAVKKVRVNRTTVWAADITVIAAILLSIIISSRPDTERIMQMVHESGKGNWTKVLSVSKKTATGPFQCFYLNLALQQTGSLPDSMFHYKQIGVSGLMMDLRDYFHCYAAGDLFCRLGLINEIRRCSYESLVSRNNYREYDIRNIKRLLECAVAAGDSLLAGKYRYLMSKTLFYKDGLSPDGREHSIPVTAADNVLLEGKASALEAILRANHLHRPAFEYLMAYRMLERDYDRAKECFDTYYAGLGYPSIPAHYAELLVLYKSVNKLDDSFYDTYPVSGAVRERFDMVDVLMPHVLADKNVYRMMEQQFGDTYWFYVAFPLVDISHTNEDEKKLLY
ncbi:MAG: DUF6057 family protein [Prevotellaceae bacterium]|nr:DUF6057 family protein [Prevotellaceae bacterium]